MLEVGAEILYLVPSTWSHIGGGFGACSESRCLCGSLVYLHARR
jgi:hypothetical protein